jgi:beta-lactamase regulating signal transducer with metallopeptidase domain
MNLELASRALEAAAASLRVLGSLFDATFKATLALACAGLVVALARRSSASARHLVWALAVAATLTLPVLSAALPSWEVALLPAVAAPAAAQASGPLLEAQGAVTLPAWLSAAVVLPLWVLLLWLSVGGVLLAKLAFDRLLLLELASRSRPVEGARAALARRLAQRLGVTRTVHLLESDEVSVPMTWGAFAPTLLVPAGSRSWPEAQLELALLHELAHIRRGDAFTQLLAQVACALFWFHPLVWFAGAQLRRLREYACDDTVLESGALPSRYADALLAMVREAGRGAVAGSLGMASRSQLYERMVAVLDTERARRGGPHPAVAGLAAALLVLPLAAFTPTAAAPPAVEVAMVAPGSAPLTAAPCATGAPAAPANTCNTARSALPPSEVRRRIAAQVASAPSDAALAATLVALAHTERLEDELTRQAFLKGAQAVHDELLRAQVLRALLVEAPISEKTGLGVLRLAAQATSDEGRAPVLNQFHELHERALVRGPLAAAYQRAAEGLRSPAVLAQALKAQLHPTAVPKAVVLRTLALLERVAAPQLVLEVLEEVTDHQVLDADVERAYLATVDRLPVQAQGESFVKLASARHRSAKEESCTKAQPVKESRPAREGRVLGVGAGG